MQTETNFKEGLMKFQIMTTDDFNAIVQAQAELNVKYSGEDWADKIPMSHLVCAMTAELGELLESSPRTGDTETGWKWWKPYLENDDNNNKVEAVDIIHFAKSMLIKAYGQDLNALMADYNACSTTYIEEADELLNENHTTGVANDLVSAMAAFTLTSLTDSKEESLNLYMFVINSLCHYAIMTPEEMFDLYMKKNKLNHERVEGGYMKSADAYAKIDADGNEDNVKLFED